MTPRPIHSDAEYRAALAQIEALWEAPEGSDAADMLDVRLGTIHRPTWPGL